MDLKRIIGQCAPLFFLAVTFDLVGFLVLLVGLAASPRIGDRVYGDFLAITGAILMFFGLGMWVLWYAGNLGADGKRAGFGRITRKLTERVSTVRWRGESRKTQQDEQEMEEEEVEVGEQEEEEVEKVEVGEQEEEEVEKVEVGEQEEEDDGGKSEKNAAYTNEAYEPTENETV
ncbi:transmembrane protein 238-like [Hemibagrus wyckioides]|uniref:transmembrane protein 238-like n=1 Tax=Hemibagrus wyckioides TaxID=337641 RepID=UPI00266D2A32|nr:transmembrane protein 238-like [Hemibagrus wyckioides]